MTEVITIEQSLYYEEECYKSRWLVDMIINAIDKQAHVVTNTDKLQRRVMVYIGKYISKDEKNINNKSLIKRMVHKKVKETIGRYGVQEALYYEGFSAEDEETPHYEPPDILADVGKIIERRNSFVSLVDTLASGDDKKRMVLTALASGFNESQTADILANVCGGKSSGHRSFIKRFKKQCREALA